MERTLFTVAAALVLAALVAVGASAQSEGSDPYLATAQALFAPLPDVMADQPIDPALVELGKMLYYEPRLSLSGLVSCNTCHNLATYGVDNLPTSIGHDWAVGPRNAPTVLNAAMHDRQFWDGRAADVEEQALGPILNPIEMAMPNQALVLERLTSIPEYVERFRSAFAGQLEPLTYANVGAAIGAFERTLTTPSRFDAYVGGDANALTDLEKAGLGVFLENGCAGCHHGSALGGDVFARFGIVEAYWEATRAFVTIDSPTMPMDVGVYAVTHDPDDLYVFKTPSLRNVTRTYPYFHDGSVWNLGDAVQVMARVQLGDVLSDGDLEALLAFFDTLEGDIPASALQLPVLPASTDATPRPRTR